MDRAVPNKAYTVWSGMPLCNAKAVWRYLTVDCHVSCYWGLVKHTAVVNVLAYKDKARIDKERFLSEGRLKPILRVG